MWLAVDYRKDSCCNQKKMLGLNMFKQCFLSLFRYVWTLVLQIFDGFPNKLDLFAIFTMFTLSSCDPGNYEVSNVIFKHLILSSAILHTLV